MKPEITTLLTCDGHARWLEMRISPPVTFVFVRAVLHKEFVRPKSDQLLERSAMCDAPANSACKG